MPTQRVQTSFTRLCNGAHLREEIRHGVKMVKVEPNPDTMEMMDISDHHPRIDNILYKYGYRLMTQNINSEYFHADIQKSEKHTIKSKWPFRKPIETTRYRYIAHVAFELSTMSIVITGDEIELMDVAKKLEDVGYNVTIWT